MHQRPAVSSQAPRLRLLAAATLSACLAFSGGVAQATVTTGTMSVPRMVHQASTLPDGRVLFTGGYVKPGTAPYASAELYDPATGLFSPVAPMQSARSSHAAVTLRDGRVMVLGGSIATSPSLIGTKTTEIFDPATGQWTSGPNMIDARWRAMARALPNGKVFVMSTDGYPANAEVYDPETNTFTKTPPLPSPTSWNSLVVLADGRVMSVGGESSSGYRSNADIWDPATNTWTPTGSMAEARETIRPVLLPDGKVLVAGGRNVTVGLKTAEIYDPATGLFTPASPMPDYLSVDASATLPNGDIILTGAYYKDLVRYQIATGTWNVTGPKAMSQREASLSVLPGGDLLLAGGAALNDASNYAAVWNLACAPQKITLIGATQTLAGDGATANVTVNGAPGCRFEVRGLPDWLTLVGSSPMEIPASGSLPVSFSAPVNNTSANRIAAFTLGNTAVSLTQSPSPSCPAVPTVSPDSFNFSYSAQSGTLSVSTVASCPWSIRSLPSWVTPTTATSGTGSGSVRFTIAANTGAARGGNGQLDALGGSRSFTISQAAMPACPSAPLLSSFSVTHGAGAASGTISVTAAATCPWSIGTPPSWISVSGASGTGNGSFTYTLAANTGGARQGYVNVAAPGVATASLSVNQQAGVCEGWSITPSVASFPAAGVSGSFSVTAASGCAWSLSALPTWLSASTPLSGAGNGVIGYTVAANAGAARTAVAKLAGTGPSLLVSLSQADGNGTVVVPSCTQPITVGVLVNSTLQASNCGAGARGADYKTDRYSFAGAPGQQVTIFAMSSSFDTYLYLRSPNGTVIASNDDGFGGTNSRIPANTGTYTLPAGTSGTYTIEVSSFSTSGSGPYQLSLK